MARQSNMRWLSLTAGKKLPKRGKARKYTADKQARLIAKQNSPVTVRKATSEELANLKGIPPVPNPKKTPKRGELPP